MKGYWTTALFTMRHISLHCMFIFIKPVKIALIKMKKVYRARRISNNFSQLTVKIYYWKIDILPYFYQLIRYHQCTRIYGSYQSFYQRGSVVAPSHQTQSHFHIHGLEIMPTTDLEPTLFLC